MAVSPTPGPPEHLVALVLAGLEGYTGKGNAAHIRTGASRQLDSRAFVVDGIHAWVDALSSLSVIVSARAIAVGFTVADALIALADPRAVADLTPAKTAS